MILYNHGQPYISIWSKDTQHLKTNTLPIIDKTIITSVSTRERHNLHVASSGVQVYEPHHFHIF